MSTIIPENYKPLISVLDTEEAIKKIKNCFQKNLSSALNLNRVSAPLFVKSGTGIQDDLNGTERPIKFQIKADDNQEYEIVHSLAKWKRMALHEYSIPTGRGLYTDMNAIRPDEDDLDNLHSVYVLSLIHI